LIGRDVLLESTGDIDPSTRQYAGTPLAASTHVADDSVTLATGSPIADDAIDVPTLVELQSDAVITTSGRLDEAGPWASVDGPTNPTSNATERARSTRVRIINPY
jgi:hypothetical protein